MKLILAILVNVLFFSNYWICELFYPGSNASWEIFIPMDKLCHNIWAIIILLSLIVASMKKTNSPEINFWINTAIGLSSSDVIDRIVLETTTFTHSDYILIPVTFIIAYLNYRSEWKTSHGLQ